MIRWATISSEATLAICRKSAPLRHLSRRAVRERVDLVAQLFVDFAAHGRFRGLAGVNHAGGDF